MSPFRNSGWQYYEKFQDISPNASARGSNAFSAMRTAPPIPLNDTPNNPTTGIDDISMNDSTGSTGNTLINQMDIDRHDSDQLAESSTTSVFPSNSFGKRKLDVIASDEELNISENPIPSSKPSESPATSEMPAKKKTGSLPRSKPRSTASGPGKKTSTTHSSQAQTRAQSTSTKMTPALIAHEIQGSINSLASAVRESGLTDPVAKLRQDAIHHMSDGDDGLSAIDKIAMIDLFRKDYAAVQTYIALLNHNDLRKPWLEKQLKELNT
jgi:hypothetical protein